MRTMKPTQASTVAAATRIAVEALIDADKGINAQHRAAILQALDAPPEAVHEYMTATAAAVDLGVATITVCRWIDAGRLAGFRVGDRTTVVSAASVAALKKQLAKNPRPVRQTAERPPKAKRSGEPLADRLAHLASIVQSAQKSRRG